MNVLHRRMFSDRVISFSTVCLCFMLLISLAACLQPKKDPPLSRGGVCLQKETILRCSKPPPIVPPKPSWCLPKEDTPRVNLTAILVSIGVLLVCLSVIGLIVVRKLRNKSALCFFKNVPDNNKENVGSNPAFELEPDSDGYEYPGNSEGNESYKKYDPPSEAEEYETLRGADRDDYEGRSQDDGENDSNITYEVTSASEVYKTTEKNYEDCLSQDNFVSPSSTEKEDSYLMPDSPSTGEVYETVNDDDYEVCVQRRNLLTLCMRWNCNIREQIARLRYGEFRLI